MLYTVYIALPKQLREMNQNILKKQFYTAFDTENTITIIWPYSGALNLKQTVLVQLIFLYVS